ncbi:hypothetical protein Dda_1234 [Drechslerella dactyloides]|uniref:Protein kinase domain-containing protein n=1 Tax=Drechslerella dactyloides TaxID=74499 RepID=A0AAD6J5Y0_DREDA|nr:hypothetical protein Dda_1234 [Drechslerella dactyloides]
MAAAASESGPESAWSLPSAPNFTPSASRAVVISRNIRHPSEDDASERMLQLGRTANIIGPKLISRERYEAEALGSGAKFEVFGHKLPVQQDGDIEMLWEGIDVRRIAFKRGKTSFKKPHSNDDLSSSWVAVVSGSQDSLYNMHTEDKRPRQLEQVAAVLREMKTLARPTLRDHRNIVELFAWGFDMDDFNTRSLMTPILVQERAWGTFGEILATDKLSTASIYNLCHDALQGLVALHREGFYHGDINPKNILVFQDSDAMIAKISDFSHSGLLPLDLNDGIWYQGTRGWQAPEVDVRLPTSKADILALEAYSFGLVLWSALGIRGSTPLKNSPGSRSSLPKFAHRCMESYQLPVEISKIVVPLVPRLLQVDPNTRDRLSEDILERKVEVFGRKLVLQTHNPIDFSMDAGFKRLDQFADDMDDAHAQCPALDSVSPFLRLILEEAYVRDIASRLRSLPSLPIYNIPAFKSPDLSAYRLPTPVKLKEYAFKSLHRLEEIDQERQSGAFTSLTAEELFDTAIGFYSFDATRGLLYLLQAASAGDVRAQALYEPLSLAAKMSPPIPIPSDTLQQWAFNALATGFGLNASLAVSQQLATRIADSQFRENSGFNSYLFAPHDRLKTAESLRMDLEPIKEHLRTSRYENYVGQIPRVGSDGNSILHYAALAGDVDMVSKLVSRHCSCPWSLNATNKDGETALLFACRGGNAHIARILLENGASGNVRDGWVSPLHWLFVMPQDKMDEICDLLVTKGKARLNAVAPATPAIHFPFTIPQGSPLVWAVAAGSLSAVTTLSEAIARRASLDLSEKESCFTGAIKLAMVRHEAEFMKAMIGAASPNGISLMNVASEAFDWSVLSVPEGSEDIPVSAMPIVGDWKDEIVRAVRHRRADEETLRETLCCFHSLQNDRVTAAEDEGALGNSMKASFMYLKQVIAQGDSLATLRLLQRWGASYSKSDLGRALFINIHHNWATPNLKGFPSFMDIFRALINAGADVNVPNPLPNGLGNSLLHVVLRKYSDESSSNGIQEVRSVVILLLKIIQSSGADINKKNLVGMSIMDYALHNNRNYRLDEELVDMLHKWGSKSTFRLLPMNVEGRIGDWASRQLEWQKPEPPRVDRRQGGGNLALLWDDMQMNVSTNV